MPNKKKKGAKRMSKCFKCEDEFPSESLLEIKRGMRFCEPCHASTYFKCGACAKTKPRNEHNPKTIMDLTVCEYCFHTAFRKCKACQVQKKTSEGITSQSGNFYCSGCASSALFHCAYCGRDRDIDNLWQRTEEDGPVCGGCQSAYMAKRHPPSIHNYSYKPPAEFQGKAPNKLFFGVELEVDTVKVSVPRGSAPESTVLKNNKNAKLLREAAPFLYIKSDGSVPCGFEIVTHPMSFDWVKENRTKFAPIWDLVKKGYVSHDSPSCGMHIHMSRNAFTPLQLVKFMKFFYKNEAFILVVSQRGSVDRLNAYSRIKYEREGRKAPSMAAMAKGDTCHDGRYQAVNLQNEHTVEIRIFRGTLKRERFFKNIEFCQALFNFTMAYSEADCMMEKFLGYITVNKSDYPHLYAFLAERYKWKVLKKGNIRGAWNQHGVRYSGVMEGVDIYADKSDVGWDELMATEAGKRDATIAKKIESAKATR